MQICAIGYEQLNGKIHTDHWGSWKYEKSSNIWKSLGNACDIENIAPLNEVQVTNNYKTTETKLREFADGSEDLGAGLEIAGAPITEGGQLVVLGTLGEISTAVGTVTNSGLDFYEGFFKREKGKVLSGFGRLAIFGLTFGFGKAIQSLKNAGKIQKIDEKILKSNNIINEKSMEKAKENFEENKHESPDFNKEN